MTILMTSGVDNDIPPENKVEKILFANLANRYPVLAEYSVLSLPLDHVVKLADRDHIAFEKEAMMQPVHGIENMPEHWASLYVAMFFANLELLKASYDNNTIIGGRL